MAKVFYDRNGKAHTLERGRPNDSKPNPKTSPKPKKHKKEPYQSPKGPDLRKEPARKSRAAPSNQHKHWLFLKAVVDKNKRGTSFLVFDRRDLEDLKVPYDYPYPLFHGDRVEVQVDSRSGEIENIKILKHRFREIFGRVFYHGKQAYLSYERKKTKEEVFIPSLPKGAKEGDWIKAEMIYSQEGRAAPFAKVVEVIGQTLPAKFDIQMVAGEFNLVEEHSAEAIQEAESYTLNIPGPDEEGRTDLRHLPFMTIDGESARDFDDAVYVEKIDQGYRLWVAIADVSHYVKPGTFLDQEAYQRGTSVYFPERAFHMLPSALSENLCSLKPNVPRLAMACSVDYLQSAQGTTKSNIQIYDAMIESKRRATYNEIEREKNEPRHQHLFELYRILRKVRTERGSIDFEFPEAEVILDKETAEPVDIVLRERFDAHRLIEEFMIAANESVTEWMLQKKLPFIYRIHEEPSFESIEKFKKLAKNFGVTLFDQRKGIHVPKPKIIAEFIQSLKGHAAEPVLATALLRSMRQAIYTATYGEHYGLASTAYTHFTSPIRRYPDLLVHRELRKAMRHLQPAHEEDLESAAEHCSFQERVAAEADREAVRFKQVRLMAKKLGEIYSGKVVGLNERGMFVQILSPFCEGMVPIDHMQDDWYEYFEERMQWVGRKKKRIFRIGTELTIQVGRVDLDSRQIEFSLIENKR